MFLSTYLTRSEWEAAYVLYALYVTLYPDEFPLEVSLRDQLTRGIGLLLALGYQGWKGIAVQGELITKLDPIPDEDNAISIFQEMLGEGIHLHAVWVRVVAWISTVEIQGDQETRLELLEALRERQELLDPVARIKYRLPSIEQLRV